MDIEIGFDELWIFCGQFCRIDAYETYSTLRVSNFGCQCMDEKEFLAAQSNQIASAEYIYLIAFSSKEIQPTWFDHDQWQLSDYSFWKQFKILFHKKI